MQEGEKSWGFIKRKMSGTSPWAGMHPQPEAFLRPASLQISKKPLLRQERNPHRYPVTRLTRAHKAALFVALQGLLKMGKSVLMDLLCTEQLHPLLAMKLTPDWHSQIRGGRESLYPLFRTWVDSSSLSLPNQ